MPVWAGRFLADARLRFPRGTHATVTQQTPPFFFFFFFWFSRVSRVISYCAAVYVGFSSVNSAFVHCSRAHKFHFSQFFFIKNGSHSTIHIFKKYFATVFLVSVFSFSKNKLNPNGPYMD